MQKKIFGFIILLNLFSCSAGSGGGNGGTPINDPSNPPIDEQSLATVTACNKISGSYSFYYITYNFTNNDKYITCTVSNSSIQANEASFLKPSFSGYLDESCFVVFDSDGTPTSGFWEFRTTSGTKTTTYRDTGSSINGSVVTFNSNDCGIYNR